MFTDVSEDRAAKPNVEKYGCRKREVRVWGPEMKKRIKEDDVKNIWPSRASFLSCRSYPRR
jgi:hypothetical protein